MLLLGESPSLCCSAKTHKGTSVSDSNHFQTDADILDAKLEDYALLAGVTSRGLFWLGSLFCRFLIGLHPLGVKNARLVDAFVSVCAEEVALRLQQVRRQTLRTVTVEVSKRCG